LLSGIFLTGKDSQGLPDGNPYVLFAIMSVFAGALGITGLFIDKSLEENQTEMMQMHFWTRTKFVLGEVKQGLKIKELYSTLLFRVILGSVVPSFSYYLYYY
jgi:MFS family permease